MVQGAAFLVLGAAEAYSMDRPGRGAALIGPLALLAAAIAIPFIIFAMPGEWSLDGMSAALDARRGFYVFLAMAGLLAAAGLSRLGQDPAGRNSGNWVATSLFAFALCGVLYVMLAWRVNGEAWHQVMFRHAPMCATLILAVILKAENLVSRRRSFHMAWAVLLMITAVQLLTYTEFPEAFGWSQSESYGAAQVP